MPRGVYERKPGLKRKPPTLETRAKISAANKGRYIGRHVGELSPTWKGDGVGSQGAHHRHQKALPRVCARKDATCSSRLEAAFRHDTPPEFVKQSPDGPYSTRTEDYQRLCTSHHRLYDIEDTGLREED